MSGATSPPGDVALLDEHAVARQLTTRWLGRAYQWLDSTDSTNRVAAEWAVAGAPHGAAVVAEGQEAGRGRLGRSFFSPPYRNLYTSIVLRGAVRPSVVFAAAVAVARASADTLGSEDEVEIKWPNDVLVDERKCAGILVESLGSGEERFAVLGIGVNLNIAREEFPEEFRERATSLAAACGHNIDRAGFTARLYGTLEGTLERHEDGDFEAIRPDFEAFFRMRGRRVRVHDVTAVAAAARGAPDPTETAGRVIGVDPDGALRLMRDDGFEERVLAGDVTVVKGSTP